MRLPITFYGISTLLCLGLLYSRYFTGINPASLTGHAGWYAFASFWLHFAVLFVWAAVPVTLIRRLLAERAVVGHIVIGLLGALVTLWLFIDTLLFGLFGLHINRLFIEALLQRDAIGAIGASPTAMLASLWPLAVLLLPQIFIAPLSRHRLFTLGKRGTLALLLASVALLGLDKFAYSFYYYRGAPFVFELKNAAPVYPTPHPYHIGKVFEQVLGRENRITFMAQMGERLAQELPSAARFNYPVVAPEPVVLARPLNIVLVVAESIRAADFNPDTAPFLSSLAESAVHATLHHSSSNSTHLGLFSLFYGINPHFFHDARVGRIPSAPLVLLAESGYELHQSLSFSMEWYDMEHFVYGGHHQTYLSDQGDVIARDRAVTNRSLALARDAQQRGTPYFNFAYYYAPHADYSSPPEAQVFQPALEGPVNFANPRLRDQREALLNRYRNAIRFIDDEMRRLVEGLQAAGVWEQTLFIFTSDHGEEFFEKGRYGHNSALNHYQTQVPFIMHVPGLAPKRIERLTSHTDVIGSVLTLLGAPPAFLANTQGHDLFHPEARPIYIGNAHFQRPERYAILAGDTKIEINLAGGRLKTERVTTLLGDPLPAPDNTESKIIQLLSQFRAFSD